MPKPRRAGLGPYLEWHGRTIRVVVRVPPSRVAALGKTKLKESLNTANPRDAEVLKWPVITRLKREVEESRRQSAAKDPLLKEAFRWREAVASEEGELESGEEDRAIVPELITDRAEEVERTDGRARAKLFASVALGDATPVATLVDDWLREKEYAGRTEAARRHSVRLFLDWCHATGTSPTVEGVTRKVAGRFVTEEFVARSIPAATANKTITGLSSLWEWLKLRGHTEAENPWTKQSVRDKDRERRKGQREPGETDKRPFTDEEAARLLTGLKDPLLLDFSFVAALTGMRRDEIATLRARHVTGGVIKVPGTKTAAAVRDVPVHPLLAPLLERRTAGKAAAEFVFHELPEQRNPARGRGAPVTQAFTRHRRALGVDDTPPGARQSRVDFHSWRRWFIRQAVSALEEGATGFTAWTIADVVGHSNEDGPLPMTLGRYPGKAPLKALQACVEAVRLPDAVSPPG